MKKLLRSAAILLLVLILGTDASGAKDVATLQPVQVVCMTRAGETVILWTDTGDQGMGATAALALECMRSGAAGEIFLDTAEYLLLTEDCLHILEEMNRILRPSCNLCLMEGTPDLEKVGQFLRLHSPDATLMAYRAGKGQLPTLKTEDGRMTLVS